MVSGLFFVPILIMFLKYPFQTLAPHLIIGIKSWIFDTNIVTKSMIKFSILVKWSGILMWLIQGRNQPGGIVPNGKIRQP
jgi:hypothetical protein